MERNVRGNKKRQGNKGREKKWSQKKGRIKIKRDADWKGWGPVGGRDEEGENEMSTNIKKRRERKKKQSRIKETKTNKMKSQ